MKRVLHSLDTQQDITKRIRIIPDSGSQYFSESENLLQPSRESDYDLVWNQLQLTVKNLVCDGNASINQKEINDVLLVVSQDPDRLTFFECDYGSVKVETAIKAATSLLYPNATIDLKFSKYLWWKRNELICGPNISYWNKNLISCNWMAICEIGSMLFNEYIFNVSLLNRSSIEMESQRHAFIILMAVEPNLIREKIATLDIGQSKVEIAISLCTHILEGLLKQYSNSQVVSFRERRNKKIKSFWERYLKQTTANHDTTLERVRLIVNEYWKNESNDQADAFAILLMMEPKTLYSKMLFFSHAIYLSTGSIDDIEKKLNFCLHPSDKEKAEPKVEMLKQDSMPIIVYLKVEGEVKRFHKKINRFLTLRLSVQYDTKISIVFGFKYGRIVCANESTLEWLTAILNELPNVSIDKYNKLASYDFREVSMLSSARLKNMFSFYTKEIKRLYPYLRTDLWNCSSKSDYNLVIEIDMYSIAHLELLERRIKVEELVFKFEIRYF